MNGLEPLLGILLEAVQDDAFEVRREIGGVIRHPRRIRLQDRAHRLDRRVGAECGTAGQHLVEDEAEGEDVGAMVGGRGADLFRRHVARGAEDHPDFGVRNTDGDGRGFGEHRGFGHGTDHRCDLGEAEVEDLDASVASDEDVVRLEVAVDDALVVRGAETAGELRRDLGCLARRHRRAVDPLAQRLALEQLRDDVGCTLVSADVVDREDVGMVQHPGRACFLLEAAQSIGIRRKRAGQDLDRDIASEPRVFGAIDFPHSAGANQRHYFIGAKLRARRNRRCCWGHGRLKYR